MTGFIGFFEISVRCLPLYMKKDLEKLSDQELVERLKQGCVTAYGVLVSRHDERIFHFCLCLAGGKDYQLATDFVQETYLRALEKIQLFREPFNFSGWLKSIARGIIFNYFRRQARERNLKKNPHNLFNSSPSDAGDTLQLVEEEDLKEAVRREVNALPSRIRDCFLAHYICNLTAEEIANIHHISKREVYRRCRLGFKIVMARFRRMDLG